MKHWIVCLLNAGSLIYNEMTMKSKKGTDEPDQSIALFHFQQRWNDGKWAKHQGTTNVKERLH